MALDYHDALLRKLARKLAQRSDIMAQALNTHLPGSYAPPSSGSSFRCRLPETVNAAQLKRAAAQKGILVISGDSYHYADNLPQNCIKLGFSAIAPDAIDPAIRILAELVRELGDTEAK